MFRSRANIHLTAILTFIANHSRCLNSLFHPEKELSQELLDLMLRISDDLLVQGENTHLFAQVCNLDRSSTGPLVNTYKKEISGCLWLYKKVALSENIKLFTGHDIHHYLSKLSIGLGELKKQLRTELNIFIPPVGYGPIQLPLPGISVTGASSPSPVGSYGNLQLSPQGNPAPSFSEGLLQMANPPNLFSSAPSPASLPKSDPTPSLEPLLASILSKLTSSELKEQEMKTQTTRILDLMETHMNSEAPQKKKRGRKSKKVTLSFQEQIYLLLLGNFDLLLIRYLGKQSACDFLALVCGGNERDVRGHLNYYRREEYGSDEDEKYELEGKFPELKKRALNYLGPLPGLILKLVRKS